MSGALGIALATWEWILITWNSKICKNKHLLVNFEKL